MHLVYYDELDPFRGGIRPEMEDLPTLIADLALLLSRYDTVLLPTEALAAHPLALEHFADFVHSGRLTVSAPPLSPSAYLRSQVETPYVTTAQKRPHSSRRAVAHQQQTNEARRRWESVTPSRWTVQHDADLKRRRFREHLTKYLETTESPTDATNHLLAVMDTASMQGVELSRGTLLASLAAVRNYVAPRDIAPAAALLHIAELHAIAQSHAGACESFSFFPGPWARAMRERSTLLTLLGWVSAWSPWRPIPGRLALGRCARGGGAGVPGGLTSGPRSSSRGGAFCRGSVGPSSKGFGLTEPMRWAILTLWLTRLIPPCRSPGRSKKPRPVSASCCERAWRTDRRR